MFLRSCSVRWSLRVSESDQVQIKYDPDDTFHGLTAAAGKKWALNRTAALARLPDKARAALNKSHW